MRKKSVLAVISAFALVFTMNMGSQTVLAQDSDYTDLKANPFSVVDGLFDQTKVETNLGLDKIDGAETVTVFTATDDTDHYCNGVVMAEFKGKLYCQWQSSQTDEDAEDTWVAYSVSDNEGKTWSAPKVLAASIENGYCSSGGWYVNGDKLVSYINVWRSETTPRGGFAYYTESTDGENWSAIQPVLMKDGTPMKGIIEQDPHVLASGRIICAAHFQPGLFLNPIYTDDPSGVKGWVRAQYTNIPQTGTPETSLEMEPSLFVNEDGNIVMTFRDQSSSFVRLAAVSTDQGETWSDAVSTNMPDCRAKQSAGNLPDGTAYLVGCSVNNKNRWPLTITLSADGKTFNKAYVLRTYDEFPALKYTGKAKRLGFHYPKSVVIGDYLYISYATSKEYVQYTRIPLAAISLNPDVTAPEISGIEDGGVYTDTVSFTVSDKNLKSVTINGVVATPTDGKYILTASEDEQVIVAEDAAGNKVTLKVLVKKGSPQTGDHMMLPMFAGLLLASGALLVTAKKKKRA
jgi:LPXTG-motif cell wall-anchored protein